MSFFAALSLVTLGAALFCYKKWIYSDIINLEYTSEECYNIAFSDILQWKRTPIILYNVDWCERRSGNWLRRALILHSAIGYFISWIFFGLFIIFNQLDVWSLSDKLDSSSSECLHEYIDVFPQYNLFQSCSHEERCTQSRWFSHWNRFRCNDYFFSFNLSPSIYQLTYPFKW